MFDLYVSFKPLSNRLLILLLATGCCLWLYRCLKRKSHFILAPFTIISLLLFIAWARIGHINTDEAEHLHCAWMVSQGLIPYRDFWQHHSPFLWIILSPLFKIIKPTVLIFDLSRIFSGLIFAAAAYLGWQIAKKAWQEKANLCLYLLILFSAGIYGEFFRLRPDSFMTLFLLLGIYWSLNISGDRLLPSFFAGISFGLAASFIFKQYLVFLLPFIVIILKKLRSPTKLANSRLFLAKFQWLGKFYTFLYHEKNKSAIFKLLAVLSGMAVGSLPLLYYLTKNKIMGEFFYWVFEFNRERIAVTIFFPVAILCLGIWGAYSLLDRYRNSKDTESLILFLAFCLSSLSSLTNAVKNFMAGYYLGFWFILCAAVSSGCGILKIYTKAHTSITKLLTVLIAGLFFTVLLTPNFINVIIGCGYNKFNENKRGISKLIEYCRGEKCLVFLPLHPIFSYDATRLYSDWQYYHFINEFLTVKNDAKIKNIAEQIINSRPAVIVHEVKYGDIIIIDFMKKDLILIEGFQKLKSFLAENYTVKSIGQHTYYIRNDKL